MSNHPLTDERPFDIFDIDDAIDFGIQAGRDEQLKQVLDWIRENHAQVYAGDYDEGGGCFCPYYTTNPILEELEEAMRPTTQENNQSDS